MGSGNSRLNGRLEDFRKRRNGQATLSKKQLLKDSPEEEEQEEQEDVSTSHSSNKTEKKEDNNNNNKVIIMTKEIQVQPINKEETVVQVTTTTITTIEKLSRIVPISISECEIKEEKEKEPIKDNVEHVKREIDSKVVDDADEKVKETGIKTEEGHVAVEKVEEIVKPEPNEKEISAENEEVNAKIDDDNDSDDDDDDDDEENGRLLCPGSPSFRIYFIEAEKRKEEDEEKCESSTIAVHQKSRSADNVVNSADSVVDSTASRHSQRRISNEVNGGVEMETRTKRKGKGMKKFGPVRSLMKVKSCYYPMCTCTGDERSRVNVITAKAVN